MYSLDYLALAEQDMMDIAEYIGGVLNNTTAAERIIAEMVEKAEKLTDFPYINPIHIPVKPLEYEYRKLLVGNYIMFYWVDERAKVVTISRVIYGRRDYERELRGEEI